MRILLTGSTGFVGSAVLDRLRAEPGHQLVATTQRRPARELPGVEVLEGYTLGPDADWRPALNGVDVVIHLAARVHVMRETAEDPLGEFRRANVLGSVRLAQQAAGAGVKRFVFVSSIKVNGESTRPGRPFTADDPPLPVDSYGLSKLEAERGLQEVASATGMDLAIVRPPLVYGPGVGANFRSLLNWVYRGVPLPLGAIHNRRSFVSTENLSHLILTCMRHPAAAGNIFLASDGEDLSTTELLHHAAAALGRPARLLPIPERWVRSLLAVTGRHDLGQRLCGWLEIDIDKTRRVLGWSPPESFSEALARTARWYVSERRA